MKGVRKLKCDNCICKTCLIAQSNGGAEGCGNCQECLFDNTQENCTNCSEYYNPNPRFDIKRLERACILKRADKYWDGHHVYSYYFRGLTFDTYEEAYNAMLDYFELS